MKGKLTKCKACGETLAKKAKFCPHCGAKNKKPLFKKWWFWLIIVLVVLGAIGSSGDDTASESVPTTPPTIVVTEPANEPVTEPHTEPPTEPATEPPTEPAAEQETMSKAETVDLLIAILKVSVSENFSYHKIEGDETGITVSVATDGLAAGVTLAKSMGYDENYEPWVTSKNAMIGLCDTISSSAATWGLDDIVVTVITLNDQNHDNTLLMIINGVVVYDAMAD